MRFEQISPYFANHRFNYMCLKVECDATKRLLFPYVSNKQACIVYCLVFGIDTEMSVIFPELLSLNNNTYIPLSVW